MIRDPGPSYNLGFGVNSRRDIPQAHEKQGMNPDGSFIAKSLHDHPFLKFAAASAATMVGMHVAGKLIKSGGTKLMAKGLESESPLILKHFSAFDGELRSISRTLDSWEGVYEAGPGVKLPLPGTYLTDAEKAAIASGGDPIASWSFRDRIQSKLVSQARRLPYELPAAYMAQRLPGIGTDDMFGYGDERDKPNWYNPLDVLGDFAQQSVKNLAGFLIPVEAGGPALKEGWKRLLTHADGVAAPVVKSAGVNLDQSLRLLGHNATDIIAKMVHISQKSTAAFGAGIDEAVKSNRGVVDLLHEWRHSSRQMGKQAWIRNQIDAPLLETSLFDVVQPIGTTRNFARGFRNIWSQTLNGEINTNSFDYITANSEAVRLGMSHFRLKHGAPIEVDRAAARRAFSQNSDIEQMAHAITSYVGTQGGLIPGADQMRNTELYRMKMTQAYQEHLIDAIASRPGMSRDQVEEVVKALQIKRLPTKSPMPMAERFAFGNVDQVADSRVYRDLMADALEKKVPGHGKAVINKLFQSNSALAEADATFQANMSRIEDRIVTQWSTAMRDVILPGTREKLGRTMVPGEALHDLRSEEVQKFLIRNTADQINARAVAQGKGEVIPLMEMEGRFKRQRSHTKIAHDLRGYGFDVTGEHSTPGYEQMKSFLRHNRVISKEGTEGAFNRLGFRKLSIESALDRDYFDPEIAPTIRRLRAQMGEVDPLGTGASFARTPLGHVWESRSGKILDFSPFANAFRRSADSFGENFHIPLLHINPLTQFGGEAERQMAQTPILQVLPGNSYQPFAGAAKDTDLWIYMRNQRSKGKLSRIFENTRSETLAGQYRSMPTDPYSMLGRHVRLAIGDKGQLADKERTGLKKFFSLDENQPDSIRQRVKRMKGGRTWGGVLKGDLPTDPQNPSVLARMLLDSSEGGKAALKEFMRTDPSGAASAFKALENSLRVNNLNEHTMEQLLAMGDLDGTMLERILKPGGRKITDIRTRADYLDAAASKRDARFAYRGDDTIREKMRWAYDTFVGKHERVARSQTRYLEGKSSSRALRRRGIFRRIDEARVELFRLGMIEEGLTNEGGFAATSGELFNRLEILKNSGKISKAEYTEARAAVFSTQLAFDNIQNFQAGRVRMDRIHDAITSASEISDKRLRGVLEDVAESRMDTGFFGKPKSFFRKHLGAADYQFDGVEYNPFGGNYADTAFVPTFGTAVRRGMESDGIRGAAKSVGSVLGIGTWKDPGSFSGSAIPLAHGFQRLNGFLSSAGMALDETDFGGPMDFYARGMVGKRVLPLVAGGAAFMTADRTLGGLLNDRDQNGDRNYSPYLIGKAAWGVKEAEVLAAGLPGGNTMAEKRKELEEGEVAIRKGRWWPLGNTPWKGGRVEYYRPSWYRRLRAGATFTDDTYGTPLEKFAFGYDFSPLKPFDPYHYEKKNYDKRPYPVTGEYFTGPWGPLTGVLNSTIGRVLKPARKMHEDELNWKLSQYQQVGAGGVAAPPEQNYYPGAVGSMGGAPLSRNPREAIAYRLGGGAGIGGGGSFTGSGGTGSSIGGGAGRGEGVGGSAVTSGSGVGMSSVRLINKDIEASAYQGNNSLYGLTSTQGGFAPRVFQQGKPIDPTKVGFQASDIGYKTQELMGIYGFTFGTIRSSLGIGNQDMSPKRPVLASANKAYGSTRSFWDLGLGGLGDVPTPFEGDYANIEFSEFVRRFLNRERSDINYVNPISNQLGKENPWLPGAEYFQNFKEGDPYAAIKTGEERLPGKGYEKLHKLHSDDFNGRYGALDQYKILGDIAPYSAKYRELDRTINSAIKSREDQELVDTVRHQVAEKAKKYDFSPYEYRGTDYATRHAKITKQLAPGVFQTDKMEAPVTLAGVTPGRTKESQALMESLIGKSVAITYDKARPTLAVTGDAIPVNINAGGKNINQALLQAGGEATDEGQGLLNAGESGAKRALKSFWENVSHRDTPINTKFLPEHTALEDWERHNVYGATFPQWQHPIQDFLKPAVYKATNRGPVLSALALGSLGGLFGATGRGGRGGIIGTLVGSVVGFSAGLMRNAEEVDQGQRFIPKNRKKELAAEEYSDILNYIKYRKLANESAAMGDSAGAAAYMQQSQRTMYGADLHGDINNMMAAVPDRKRPYFKEMLHAPKKDRGRILSTAGRLERRLYEAAWGMDVEARPDLGDYFEKHELPGEDWEGWAPDADMENVKIKVAQSMGLDVAQMGYYPQQIAAANAVNMSYPDIKGTGPNTQHLLQAYLSRNGLTGGVRGIPNGSSSNRLVINAGVR